MRFSKLSSSKDEDYSESQENKTLLRTKVEHASITYSSMFSSPSFLSTVCSEHCNGKYSGFVSSIWTLSYEWHYGRVNTRLLPGWWCTRTRKGTSCSYGNKWNHFFSWFLHHACFRVLPISQFFILWFWFCCCKASLTVRDPFLSVVLVSFILFLPPAWAWMG